MQRLFVLRNPVNANQLWGFLRSNWPACAQAGKPLAVLVTEHKAKRSDEQNAKFHAMLRDLSEQAWVNGKQFSPETWKEFIRVRFIGTEEIDFPDGRRIERGISTTKLSVSEFSELIERVMQYAAEELGIVLT